MSMNIRGIAITPTGDSVDSGIIRITAIASEGDVIMSSEAVIKTGPNGDYDFILQDGKFLIDVNFDDEYTTIGTVAVAMGDTSGGSSWSLGELMDQFEYVPPVVPVVTPTDGV